MLGFSNEYIQSEGINQDFGVYNSPDELLREHHQEMSEAKALAEWNYIESAADITYLMEEYSGFEDAILKELSYISGEYIDKGIMHENPVGQKQIRLLFNSDWADEIEIVLCIFTILI